MSDPVELLFFDTFSHENSEELNLDLVQFPKPVFISEVRVIPLGARVQADFPGGVRLGATNPSQFSIEFFVNDLGKPGASTFESLGGFEYNQNGCIHLECGISETVKRQIPTDGLVLRGWYTTITLAVYGTLTRVITEQISVSAPPPVIPAQPVSIPTEVQPQILTPTPASDQTWAQSTDVNISNSSIEYNQPVPVYGPPQNYQPTEVYNQEYPEYYNNEPPKDPRAYHHSEPEWDSNNKPRTSNSESRPLEPHSRRDRIYSRSHSRDRDYRENSRDSSDYESRVRDRSGSIEYRDKDWDRYKHQDVYKRGRDRSYERDEPRKRPRTPPISSTKRPHTPHGDVKDLSPGDVESISEEEIGGGPEIEPVKFKHNEPIKELDDSPMNKILPQNEDSKLTPLQSPTAHNEDTTLLDVEEFEPILSDEDICDEGEQFQDLDYDYSEYVNNDDLIKLFNPFNADIQHYSKPSLLTEINDFFILKPEDDDLVLRMEKNILDKFNAFFHEKGELFNKLNDLLLDLNVNMFQHFNSEHSGEIKEEWVQTCDQIPSLLENNEFFEFIVELYLYLHKRNSKDGEFIEKNPKYIQGKSVLMTLLDWVKIGLNFDFSLSQIQPGFKIRHIKCGIRLVEAISQCNGAELLLTNDFDVQMKLIELYHKEYMALSIKLMILKALDSTLWSKHGIEYFITTERNFNDKRLNGYQILLEMLNSNPLVRIKFALNSILYKLNTYEVLKNVQDLVSQWLTQKYLENEYCCNTIPEKEMDDLSFMFNNISKTYRYDSFSMSQPKRFLPVSAQFEVNKNPHQKNICYVLFGITNFLENCLILLTHRTCNNMVMVTNSMLEILCEMLSNQQGLKYLSENCETTNMIIRSLLLSSNNEDDAQYSRAQLIGLELAYKLQALYHVDSLFDLSKKYAYDFDATEILDQLHLFYCLTFSNVGKTAVADVLSLANNLNCLYQFFNVSIFDSKQEKDEIALIKLKKSPGMGYIVDLIGVTLNFATNVSYLETFGTRLLKVSNNFEFFEPSTCNKLQEIRTYLKPFEVKNIFAYEDITPLCDIISNSIPNVIKIPEELITCLRILVHLGISSCKEESETDYTELKYKYVILQLYSLDGVTNLSTILQKVCEYFEQPNVHTAQLAATQGAIIVNIVHPCVLLIKKMITNVIAVRNTQYKDLTTIPILLQTYTLMNAFPTTSILYQKACSICQEIIETFLAYTQPVSEEINENESLNKSLWTLMINEILKYTTSVPFTFIPGLLVFSELLPLPFPILTKTALTEHEITRAVNLRKLWSAHLHSRSANIQEVINTLMASSYQPLLHLLRRVCIQLSDLAANTALMICRGILENIYNTISPKLEKTPMEPLNGHAARLLNFLASLLTHGAIKCAVMYLLKTNHSTVVKGDEKFPLLIGLFCEILRTQSESQAHVQAQECVVSIIQSLCDSEITLYHNIEYKTDISSDVYLSNALPPRDILQTFIITMLEHIMAPESSYTTILPIVRTFVLLTEHDYGFYHLQMCIEKKSKPFYNVFTKFTKNFSKDNADCLATLSAMLEFLRICLSTDYMEVEPGVMFTPRSTTMPPSIISASLDWNTIKTESSETNEAIKHPITIMENLLQENIPEEEGLEPLSDNLAGLLKALNVTPIEKMEPPVEPLLPPSESLLVQFNGRSIFTITNEVTDERMSTAYWLSAPTDENDADQEQVPCDLSEMSRQLLPPEINLCRETERICQVSPCPEQITNDQLKIKRNVLDQHRYMTTTDKMKRPFVTPMRGRGFLRTPPQRGDPFRSRPPNTSRPPSLHVDDFVALETCGAQPTGPTGYNKLSREIMSVRGTTRGRGRAFVSPDRGSHFRQVGRGTSLWPGAHLTENSVVTTVSQHFRVATETATHFSTVRTIRGRGIPRIREAIPVVRHVRTFPR